MPDDGFENRMAQLDQYEADVLRAIDALTDVLTSPGLTTYQPERKALTDALRWLELDVTCGDCVDGRCHWGGEKSRRSIEAAKHFSEVEEACGCARHAASVEARNRRNALKLAGIADA